MTINVVVIVVMMVLAVGFTGMCTFNPGAPESGPVQEVDGRTFMDLEARAAGFPVRYPEMPEGWTNNSARRTSIAGQPAPVLGWVTPGEGFVQLTQTGVAEDDAVKQFDGSPREREREELIDGHPTTTYTSPHNDIRDLWVVDLGDVRLLVTGAAPDEEFAELVRATVNAAPVTPQDAQPDAPAP